MSTNIIIDFLTEFKKLSNDEKDVIIDEIDKIIDDYRKEQLNIRINDFLLEQKDFLLEKFHMDEYVVGKINFSHIKKFKNLIKNELNIINFSLENNSYGDKLNFTLEINFNNFIFSYKYDGYTDLKGNIVTNFVFKNDLKYELFLQDIIKSLYNSDTLLLLIKIAELIY